MFKFFDQNDELSVLLADLKTVSDLLLYSSYRRSLRALMSVPKMANAMCRATMEASEKGQMMAELEGSKQKLRKKGIT
ncbi:hypothetical protein Bca101_050429 [Brassica carinata]